MAYLSITALTLTIPVKIVPDMTFNVFGGTLNLALSIYLTLPLHKSAECTRLLADRALMRR